MDNKRRKFLKGASGLAVTMCLPMQMMSSSARAAIPSNPKKLVVLTLMGGNDAINMAIPIGKNQGTEQYDLYQGLRPTTAGGIGIPLDEILRFNVAQGLGVDATGLEMGLHPAMAGLMPLQDKLALFPATHMGERSNRSHFLQQTLYSAGLHTSVGQINADQKGWAGRYFDMKYQQNIPDANSILGQDFGSSRLALMQGDTFTLAVSDPSNADLGAGAARVNSLWDDIKGLNDSSANTYKGRYAAQEEKLFDVIARLRGVNFPAPTAAYPTVGNGNLTTLARDFSRAASMIKQLEEVEILHIQQGGYDTHNNQGASTGSQARLFQNLSDTLAAFYDDLGAYQNDVVVVVQTEFGRTAKQNQNGGTDHGQASCWMAFGGSVKGGIYGNYPGLETANLESGRFLKPTIDYRDIFSELLGAKHLGAANPELAFPSYAGPVTPLDFLV